MWKTFLLSCLQITVALKSFSFPESGIITFSIHDKLFLSPIGDDVPLSIPTNHTSVPCLTTLIPQGMNLSRAKQEFSVDDVWCDDFLDKVIFTNCTPGPYLHLEEHLYPVYRVYPDTQNAFVSGLIPKEGGYMELSVGWRDTAGVPIPSRLYFQPTKEKPLNGIRVAVKDIYDIEGLRTGGGSRALYSVQDPAAENAPSIERLIALGAILVGKTKSSQFTIIGRCADWFDQLCPYNARGDGYNDPSGSSSGSGAAIGAYGWLDVALGSDTGGSLRDPAAYNGAFAIRPTWGTLNSSGVLPQSDLLDTLGYLTRNISLMEQFGRFWFGLEKKSLNISRLHVPADFWQGIFFSNGSSNESSQAGKIFSNFVKNISEHLGVNEVNYTAFEDLWPRNESAKEYMNITYPVLCGAHQYDVLGKQFVEKYVKKHGKDPFVDPAVTRFWQFGKGQCEDAYEDQKSRKSIFQQYVDSLLRDDTLILYPTFTGCPVSRISYDTQVPAPWGWSAFTVSPFAGTPDISLTIGESNESGQTLPVSVGIIAKRGYDFPLLTFATSFQKAGIVENVDVGSSIKGVN